MFQTQVLGTCCMFNNPTPHPPESRAVYELMWKSMVKPDRPQMTIQYYAEKNVLCMPCN